MTGIDPQTSFNFAVAKVVAILLVVAGHFFQGTILWVPVTVGLFVFAYSSAYFTSKKYCDSFSIATFWASKVGRLAIPFWVTQGFLLTLFVVSGRDGIWTWQTMAQLLGQGGWLNWLGLHNPSPFGVGLWFLTLLLLFYGIYPSIARWNRSALRARISVAAFLILSLILNHAVPVGHALWVTAFGFIFGAYSARYPIGGPPKVWLVLSASCATGMLAVDWLGLKSLNALLLAGASMAIVLWLERAPLSRRHLSWMLWLSPCVLEIYLIHTYLFVRTDAAVVLQFLLSLALIITCAQLLSRLAELLIRNMPHARPAHS